MHEDALFLLGRGVHSIQDIEAHGNIGVGRPIAFHGPPGISGVDNKDFDWINGFRRNVIRSSDQARFNTSIADTEAFLDIFYTRIGMN